jgi:oxygen-independent coproporphyrinogen-3 oxidase
MRPELARLFEAARVPRYTSYPTAPHFSTRVGTREHAAWLAAVPLERPVSLYLHVPYCRQLCWYCGCTTSISADPARPAAYAELLAAEIELVAAALPGRLPVAHLHWGGGTPSSVGPAAFGALVERLRRRFVLAPGAEHAVELDPRFLEPEMAAALAAAGVNRASLGVQSFDPEVQAAINRIQPAEQTRDAVDRLRAAGIGRINVDLLYGLPRQTVESCRETVRELLACAPDRVAIFGYAHLPSLKRHQRLIDEASLPGAVERVAQFEAMAEALEAGGYVAIGLDHFARPDDGMAAAAAAGRLHRNFQGYTTDPAETLIGIGASSISSFREGYVQNLHELKPWRAAVREGRLPTARGLVLSDRDRLERELIERIMCDGAVDLAAVGARHGVPSDACVVDRERLAELERLGVVERRGSVLRVPPACRPLLRVAATVFDRYLAASPARHAVAV